MRKMRLLFKKEGRAAYISHLDTMRTLQRAIARAGISAKHTEGFNPHAYIAIALPLSLGYTSECEMMDFVQTDNMPAFDLIARLNRALPEGIVALSVYEEGRKVREIASVHYVLTLEYDNGADEGVVSALNEFLSSKPIVIMKKSKRGEKEVDISELIRSINAYKKEENVIIDAVLAAGNESLNPELLIRAIDKFRPELTPDFVKYHRVQVLDNEGKKFI
ncbi:MAG: TIGR03936 family radical SAM-associated protein [Clostridia bacterium]|nr:TIGR03936 family radical SAM-associated protein [Clostridia bacterium]